jgi:serine/threonine protein kinase
MAKMNGQAFLELVRKSGLVEGEALGQLIAELKSTAGEDALADAEVVSKKFIDAGLLTKWHCDKLLEGRHKGFFLKKYKLLDEIGRGGMSVVYLAEHTLLKRLAAIKILPKNRVEDSSYLARFHREASAAAQLDHKNIVRVYDTDNLDKTHFLAMEYVEGRDLQQIVKAEGPLDYLPAAEYIRQAAEGLANAHKNGLIHRDVKPANLLVDKKGVVKVLDLGLARFTDEDKCSLTVAYDENVLGTADYLAPEQAIDSHGVDLRADIYSLGCTMYFLLTARPPFPEGTLPQRLMQHQKQMPASIRDFRPDVPVELVDICMKMIAKKPDQRYQTMYDVARWLNSWLLTKGKGKADDAGSHSSGHLLKGTRLGGGPRGNLKPPPTTRTLAADASPKTAITPPDEDYSLADTSPGVTSANMPTVKGPGRSGKSDIFSGSSMKSTSRSRPSGSNVGKRPPPLSQPLDDLPMASDAFQALNQLPPAVVMQHQPLTNVPSRSRKNDETPLWVFVAGSVLAALVVIFIILLIVNAG